MAIDNDTRGWIMTCISGIACVLGATIICVDIVVRLFPRWHDFSIAESDGFLSASLSLSFGVMLFSSLFSMLPQSKTYLEDAGYPPRTASFLLIGLFLAGVVGIQFLSRVIHRLLPSHVVDCDHNHDDEENLKKQREEMAEQLHDEEHTNGLPIPRSGAAPATEEDEDTPLLTRTASLSHLKHNHGGNGDNEAGRKQSFHTAPSSRKPSMIPNTLTRTFSKYVVGQKENCDEEGPCMGFTDPCGQDCFKVVHRRVSVLPGHGALARHQTWQSFSNDGRPAAPSLEGVEEMPTEDESGLIHSHTHSGSKSVRPPAGRPRSAIHHTHHIHHQDHEHSELSSDSLRQVSGVSHSIGREHHHHVPTNAFMSIGLQTSLAIALHKAPEGFITYATNHANPQLGFSVFMALFIHNITEGFAMSLPLYLALDSRFKAIAWSAFFGGISQPLGAGVAALWFKLAKKSSFGAPTEGIYGGMFAVTSGVMASVALSLFSESLQLTHNKGTCIAFAFLGMAILGFSFALTAS
ncbi:hypothetical protein A1O1_04295 [Capronia coronata CBS 617.96]|uniref:Uncharacterized protein n=1 Tax=Capronia coronata CBS 617.96 TaxID=1182541 RepID=W9YPK8_9EURO|nr:uncharacterized protein A1O1_04295 [Capronia coronata CBS 617.96]EXJ91186.1 hypothetical protein A1O1_04295 [Capronia coronata CBS 617.96]